MVKIILGVTIYQTLQCANEMELQFLGDIPVIYPTTRSKILSVCFDVIQNILQFTAHYISVCRLHVIFFITR